MPITFTEKLCLPQKFKMLQKAHQLLWKIVHFHPEGLYSTNEKSSKWVISEAPDFSNAIWEPVSSYKGEAGLWPVWVLCWGTYVADEAPTNSCCPCCLCTWWWTPNLSTQNQWDAGGVVGHGSWSCGRREEACCCTREVKLQLRWEKCSEKWRQAVSPQKLIGSTANFIH